MFKLCHTIHIQYILIQQTTHPPSTMLAGSQHLSQISGEERNLTIDLGQEKMTRTCIICWLLITSQFDTGQLFNCIIWSSQRGSFILGSYPFYTMASEIAEAEDHYNGAAKEGKAHGDGEMSLHWRVQWWQTLWQRLDDICIRSWVQWRLEGWQTGW